MNNNYHQILLGKERAFVFLSIIIVLVLLTGFPENVKIFVISTTGTITGGVTAVNDVNPTDYVIGLVIFAVLLVFFGYLVHILRTPKPQKWYPQIAEEESSVGIDKNMPLENNLDRINMQLKNLRQTEEEAPIPTKKAKKITKIPNVEEIHLEHALRNINAKLQGYAKTPTVMEAPPAKSEWDDSLEQVKQKLAGVNNMKFKKAKVRKEIPSMMDIALRHESKKIQEELKVSLTKAKKNTTPITVLEEPVRKEQWNNYLENINQELEKVRQMPIKEVKIREKMPLIAKTSQDLEQKKLAKELKKLHHVVEEEQQRNPSHFLRRYVPSSREWELAKIKRHIQKKGKVENKEELAEIEKKLLDIYKKN